MAIYKNGKKGIFLKGDRNVAEVYKGSKKLFGYTDAQSGAVVTVSDVHPVEHKLKVKLRSDTLTDLSTVTVSRLGNNLFNATKILNNSVITNNGDGSITIKANSTYSASSNTLKSLCPQLKAGDTATLSFVTQSTYFKGIYLTVTKSMWQSGAIRVITENDLNSKVVFYGFNPTEEGYGTENTISNIQVNLGPTATEYKEYKEPQTATANSDGVVEGLISLSPNMTLTSDTEGVIIDCKYVQE